jgi:hypothetical protein
MAPLKTARVSAPAGVAAAAKNPVAAAAELFIGDPLPLLNLSLKPVEGACKG